MFAAKDIQEGAAHQSLKPDYNGADLLRILLRFSAIRSNDYNAA